MIAKEVYADSSPSSPAEPNRVEIELAYELPVLESAVPAAVLVEPIKLQPQPEKVVGPAIGDAAGEAYLITEPNHPCLEQPKLQKHQAIDYSIGGLEVKVEQQYVKEVKSLWSILSGHVKRRLLIMDGYVYSLEEEHNGFFVVGVWNLHNLRQVNIWPK